MKEATGELNMTVITVVAIAAIGAFFYAFIWPGIQRNLRLSTACSTAGGTQFKDTFGDNSKVECVDGTCTLTQANGKTTTKDCTDSGSETGTGN